MIVDQLKPGDKIIAIDSFKWTVDEVRKVGERLELLCHRGMSNQRFYVKPGDPVRLTT